MNNMFQLADISAFTNIANSAGGFVSVNNVSHGSQNIFNGRVAVNNTLWISNNPWLMLALNLKNKQLGQMVADHILRDPETSNKKGNRENYDAVMRKADMVLDGKNISPEVQSAIREGFKQFARFCYNIDHDLTDVIDEIKIKRFRGGNNTEAFAECDYDTIYIPMRKSGLYDDFHRNIYIGSVAHELIHVLENLDPAVYKALIPGNFPFRRTTYGMIKSVKQKDDNTNEVRVSFWPRDRWRSWVAGDEYAGVLSGKTTSFYGDLPNTVDDIVDYIKDYAKNDANAKEMLTRLLKNKEPGSEYLSSFMNDYRLNRVPLLYAIDIYRLIHKMNKLHKKEQKRKLENATAG